MIFGIIRASGNPSCFYYRKPTEIEGRSLYEPMNDLLFTPIYYRIRVYAQENVLEHIWFTNVIVV